MNRDRLRTVVAIVVIASMVLLAAGAIGATLLGGSADGSNTAHVDATGVSDDASAGAARSGDAVSVPPLDGAATHAPRALGT